MEARIIYKSKNTRILWNQLSGFLQFNMNQTETTKVQNYWILNCGIQNFLSKNPLLSANLFCILHHPNKICQQKVRNKTYYYDLCLYWKVNLINVHLHPKNNTLPFLTLLGQGDKVFIEKKLSEIIENIVLFLLQRNNCPV